MGVEDTKSRKGAALIAIIAIVAIAIIVTIFAASYNPSTTSPTTFGDPSPVVTLIRNGERVEGHLLSASFGVGERPRLLDGDQDIASVSGEAINLQQGSTVRFDVTSETSLTNPPDTLSVNAYTSSGIPIGILAIQRESSPYEFPVELQQGSYILLISATWQADPTQAVSGYVVYGYRINVV